MGALGIILHRYTKGDVGVRNNFNYGFGTSERLLLYGTKDERIDLLRLICVLITTL